MAARARRTALIAASVPEETNRTFSIEGTAFATRSAISISAFVGAPYDVPRGSALRTAERTGPYACPNMSGPYDMTQST